MSKKIKMLFVTNEIVNESTFEAGHKSFSYYLSQYCNDEAFEVAYIVTHKNDDKFFKMKSEFHNAYDFSIHIPKYIRLFTHIYHNSFLHILFSLLQPVWFYLDPIKSFFYKKGLRKINKSGWVPDIVSFEWTEMLFLRHYCQQMFPNSLLIATEVDVTFSKLYRKYDGSFFIKNLLLDRLKYLELRELRKLDIVLVLSSNDFNTLKENSIDPNKLLLISPFYKRSNQPQTTIQPQIVFFGAMNRLENSLAVEWFLNKVFIPYNLSENLKLIVVGSGTPDSFYKKYGHVTNVEITGFVEHPEEYFKTALCMVVPLTYGGGIKIKVLEAMSSSVTVLSNEIGIEGISAVPNVSYLHCKEPVEYYNAIMKLAKDYSYCKLIGEAAREMMESNYSFEQSYVAYRDKVISAHLNKQ